MINTIWADVYKTTLIKNDIFLTSAVEINEVSRPLRKIGINHIGYLKSYPDGSQVNLCNNAEWMEHYYKFKLYNTSFFETKPTDYVNGIFIWPSESPLEVFSHPRNYFDNDNGVTLIEKSEGYCEFFFFSGSRTSTWLPNFLVNNLDLLKSFIKYFKEQLHDTLQKAEHSRILIPKSYNIPNDYNKILANSFENNLSELKEILSKKEYQTSTHHMLPEKIISSLSKREYEVIHCLLNGQNAKTTAKNLFISPRTVEKHLDNIKDKLNCRTKFELVNKILSYC